MVIPFKFRLVSWLWVTEVLLVGAAGTRTANLAVGGVDVTGGVITVVIASAAVGSVIAQGSAITALNTGAAGGNISVKLPGAGTQFTAGSGTFQITIQNMDMADATAHLSEAVNNLITALT